MGLNRFSITGTSEYTPQHVPLPFETMGALGEKVKLEHDTADAALAAEKFNIQPGLRTVKHAEELNAKKNALLAEAQAQAEKTQNYGRLTQDVKEIGAIIKNDPKFQGIQRDIAQTERANKQRFDPNFKDAVQGYADDQGNVIQLESDQPFDETQYNVVAPVDFYGDHADVYNKIKEQSVKQGGPSTNLIYRTTYDAAGNELIQGFSQQGQKVRDGIAPEDVAAFADRWIQDPNNMRTRASVRYKDAYLQQKEKRNYTPEEYRQDLINNYPGYYEKTSDVITEKALGIKPAPKSSTSDNGGGTDKDALPNQYTLLVDAKSTQVATPQLKHLGLAEGPKDVPGSYMVTLDNTDGQGAIVNFAKVTQDNPEANKIISYGSEVNNLEKKLGVSDNESLIEKLKLQNPNVDFKMVGSNLVGNLIPGKSTTKEDFKFIGFNDLKTVKDNFIKSSDDYKLLVEEAKEQGLNLNDPKFKENYLKTLGVKTVEEADAMGQMINLEGDYPFTLKDGNNKTNVGDKAYLDGYVILTRDQINREMAKPRKGGKAGYSAEEGEDYSAFGDIFHDDWEEIFLADGGGNGMVERMQSTREDGSGNAVEQFRIPIKKPIQVSQIVNQNYNNSFYGDATTGKNAQHFANTYNEMIGKGMLERRHKVYSQSYTESPTTFINNLTAIVSSNRNLEADNKGRLFKILEEMKTNKSLSVEDKKEAFINFKNGLENPEQLIADYDFYMNSQPATEGKSQGGWSPTPATPLQK
jgi:hypothetical protein